MLTEPVISKRKKLVNYPVECSLMGNLYRVKMIQFAKPKISGTIIAKGNIRGLGNNHAFSDSNQGDLGVEERDVGGMEIERH